MGTLKMIGRSLIFWFGERLTHPSTGYSSQVAKDVLAIHLYTVALESSFSIGVRVLDQFHNSFTLTIVECLICA